MWKLALFPCYCVTALLSSPLSTFHGLKVQLKTPPVPIDTTLVMVEGHSVHRVAALHRKRLVGKKFVAWSPNGRFKEGANAINGKNFYRIEAVGKNLFCFFGDEEDPIVNFW